MNTQEFFSLIQENKNKSLLYEYSPTKLVGANYHITEVKHVLIDSVDCGAGTDAWNETIIQLWESQKEEENIEYLNGVKTLSILNKVAELKPYDMNAELKFEYSNPHFHTAQLFVNDYEINESSILIKLAIQKTDCKAKDACRVPEKINEPVEVCCDPVGGCF